MLSRIDHLVYGTPDLERGIAEIEKLLGVRAAFGGRHPGRGTHNALLSLGPRVYLEIIAPDPTQTERAGLRAFGLDTLELSKLVTWSANGNDLDQIYRAASSNGIPVGAVKAGSRQRPDGVLLRWQFTEPNIAKADGVIPFFIDWGDSPHPAQSTPSGAMLISLRAEHPNAAALQKQLEQLGLHLRVDPGPRPALSALIDSPRGRVELR